MSHLCGREEQSHSSTKCFISHSARNISIHTQRATFYCTEHAEKGSHENNLLVEV